MHAEFRAPLQARSQDTLERIERATEELLAEKAFGRITIDEIVRRARSSKGAFYTRFKGKVSLLRHLNETRFEEALAAWRAFLEPEPWADHSIEDICEGIVGRAVGIYRRRRELMRAFVIHARYHEDPEIAAKGARLNQTVFDEICALLRDRLLAKGLPDPDETVRFSFGAVMSAARDRILFAEPPEGDMEQVDRRLVTELTLMWVAYLESSAPQAVEPPAARP